MIIPQNFTFLNPIQTRDAGSAESGDSWIYCICQRRVGSSESVFKSVYSILSEFEPVSLNPQSMFDCSNIICFAGTWRPKLKFLVEFHSRNWSVLLYCLGALKIGTQRWMKGQHDRPSFTVCSSCPVSLGLERGHILPSLNTCKLDKTSVLNYF